MKGKLLMLYLICIKNSKTCIVKDDVKSNYFDCNIGVRQGKNLPPVLFSVFLNDFGRYISNLYKGLSELSSSMESLLGNDDVKVSFLCPIVCRRYRLMGGKREWSAMCFKQSEKLLWYLKNDCECKYDDNHYFYWGGR